MVIYLIVHKIFAYFIMLIEINKVHLASENA